MKNFFSCGKKEYDYDGMEITWDNGNTTTTRWGHGQDKRLYLGTCQGKTQGQIDLDIYHGRVKGYNHWQRIGVRQLVVDDEVCTWHCLMYWLCIRLMALSLHHAPRCDQLWATLLTWRSWGAYRGREYRFLWDWEEPSWSTRILTARTVVAMISMTGNSKMARYSPILWIRVKFHGQPAMCFARCRITRWATSALWRRLMKIRSGSTRPSWRSSSCVVILVSNAVVSLKISKFLFCLF